ncbi:[acyl-carrier-protein] S-malonyltransferase [Maritalea mobilis]|uniref:Malonyl CoA-acyl carrier protein transacylase n=1 Tax=Maritalea mobilis TaxID=483324 RepID=A0A4R6VTY8_9HYPH|nr:ACP S-malonyltransferase [Maritalea mobilis]TDQ63651.1 [acyl-carrier-protein] S-malonyltransferase [Maritalea mobilis]
MSSTAFTFPGQGSQAVGMGQELAEHYDVAKKVFEEVDDALQTKLSSIMFEGPDETLRLTENAQPALMAVSMAVIRVLESKGVNVGDVAKYVAGHSLGEYSALCAAGALSIADTARLLQVRGRAMQQAVPVGEGAMAAILGLEYADVEEVVQAAGQGAVVEVANDNAPGQIVVSGAASAVERAVEMAKAKGAKRAMLLPVSAPFHCTMMGPAAEAMEAALASADVKEPVVPVVSNVLAAPISDPSEIKKRLVEQVCGKVRWSQSVSWMTGEGGIDTLVELGTGKVLTGLARRINRDANALAINTPDDIEKYVESLS